MAETRIESLKKKYGYNKASYKYIIPGAEILKYIGQTVVFVDFKKNEKGEWENKYDRAVIEEIDNFNPLTMVYTCKYRVGDDPEIKTVDIIPEGFSFGDPEETGEMKRFVPLNIHYTMIEDEAFYTRLGILFDQRETIPIDGLKQLSESKEKEKTLKYSCNIGAVIKLEDGSILYTRIHDLKLKHRQGSMYSLRIDNESTYVNFLISSDQTEYDFEGIGKLKLIDLRGK